MEGMPKMPMIAPDFKFSDDGLPTEFLTRTKEYILMHYQDDPSKYENAFSELYYLRSRFSPISPDIEVVNQMKRYYAQMLLMKNRFPMEEGDPLRIPFSWIEKAIDIPSVNTYEDVNYELACVLYNIGAVYAVLAANESRGDMDSIKNAFINFQRASFPFQHIRNTLNVAKYSMIDFEPTVLTFYANLFLAQAQECMLEKSLIDHRKNVVIAKLAAYLKDIYAHCSQNLEASSLNDMISSSSYNEKLRSCDIKSEVYGAIMMVELGEQADLEKKMGHRLAYYQIAEEHVKSAFKLLDRYKLEGFRQSVLFLNDIVSAKASNARKENGFIYHERVPKIEELEFVESVCMVKPIAFDPTDSQISGEDLFASLLPMNVVKAVSIYSEKKAETKRSLMERVDAKDKELNEFLNSLKLDEINCAESVDLMKLPDMLLERSAAFNSQPDSFPDLLDKLQRVGKCVIEADHKLDDLARRLSAIDSQDLLNDVGFIAIKNELSRISEHHAKARINNVELQKALAAHSENLKLLALPLGELNRLVMSNPVDSNETKEGSELRKILNKVKELREQRTSLIEQFTKDLDDDDITRKCLTFKDVFSKELFENELDKHKNSLKYIELNLAAQDTILSALTEANANFAEYRKKLVKINESKTEQILGLTAAYDVYADVLQKADDGLKFYTKLFSLANSLSEAVEGVEMAYKEEKKGKVTGTSVLEKRMQQSEFIREDNKPEQQFHDKIWPQLDSFNRVRDVKVNNYLNYYRNKASGAILKGSDDNQQNVKSILYQPSASTSSETRRVYCNANRELVDFQASPVALSRPSFQPSSSTLSNFANVMPSSQIVTSQQHSACAVVGVPSTNVQAITRFGPSPQEFFGQPYLPSAVQGPITTNSAHNIISSNSQSNAKVTPSLQSISVAAKEVSRNRTHLFGTAGRETPLGTAGRETSFGTAGRETIFPDNTKEKLIGLQFSGISPSTFAPPTLQKDNNVRNVMQNNFTHFSGRIAPNVSPWHQSLYANQPVLSSGSRLIHNESSDIRFPQSELQRSVNPNLNLQENEKLVIGFPAMDDLMNLPLGNALPTPLIPVNKQVGPFVVQPSLPNIANSNEEHLKTSAFISTSSGNSIEKEAIPLASTTVVREEASRQKAEAIVPPIVRPAAAVAPIIQSTVTIPSVTDAVLGMTNVTSLSYFGSSLNLKVIRNEDSVETRDIQTAMQLNEGFDQFLDSDNFSLGEIDVRRIEKRQIHSKFQGCSASLLNPSDPLNCIDAHFWVKK